MLLKPKHTFWQKMKPRNRLDWMVIIMFATAMAVNLIQYMALEWLAERCYRGVWALHIF